MTRNNVAANIQKVRDQRRRKKYAVEETANQLDIILAKFRKNSKNEYPIFKILRDSTSDAMLVDVPVCLGLSLITTVLGITKLTQIPMAVAAELIAATSNYNIRKIFREGEGCTMLGGVLAGVVKYGLRDYMNSEKVFDLTTNFNRANLLKAIIVVVVGGVNILEYELCRSGITSSITNNDPMALLRMVAAIEVGVDGIGQGLVKAALVGTTLGAFSMGVALNSLAAVAITSCIFKLDMPYGDAVKAAISSVGTFVSKACSDMITGSVIAR